MIAVYYGGFCIHKLYRSLYLDLLLHFDERTHCELGNLETWKLGNFETSQDRE